MPGWEYHYITGRRDQTNLSEICLPCRDKPGLCDITRGAKPLSVKGVCVSMIVGFLILSSANEDVLANEDTWVTASIECRGQASPRINYIKWAITIDRVKENGRGGSLDWDGYSTG